MVLTTSSATSEAYRPTSADKFSFGLWTVGNPGRDPFGSETRAQLDPNDSVRKLAELGAYGISMHDDDLVPFGASASERDAIVGRFRKTLDDTGMVVVDGDDQPLRPSGLQGRRLHLERPGGAPLRDRQDDAGDRPRRRAGREDLRLLGRARGRRGDGRQAPADALDRYREAIDFLSEYVIDHKYPMRFAFEPKPNEPRGDTFLPTVGHALAFIGSLAHPEMVGLNPEVAHETMSGLSFYHAVAQTIWHGKLFHIDLNGQKIGRYDQDLRFGSEDLKDAFFLVKLLEESGYQGPRHFDAHAYRNEERGGRLGLRRRLHADVPDPQGEGQALRRRSGDPGRAGRRPPSPELAQPTVGRYSAAAAAELRGQPGRPGRSGLAAAIGNERLDQLVMELLMGIR